MDKINPDHYKTDTMQCIDALEAMLSEEEFIGYLRGNSFKYLWRWRSKGGIEDLQKSQWYTDRLVATMNKGNFS